MIVCTDPSTVGIESVRKKINKNPIKKTKIRSESAPRPIATTTTTETRGLDKAGGRRAKGATEEEVVEGVGGGVSTGERSSYGLLILVVATARRPGPAG